MKTPIALTLTALLTGCAIDGASIQPFPPPAEPTPEGYAQIRLSDYAVQGNVGGRLGLGTATGRADGCVVTIVGELPRAAVVLRRGDCVFEQMEALQ